MIWGFRPPFFKTLIMIVLAIFGALFLAYLLIGVIIFLFVRLAFEFCGEDWTVEDRNAAIIGSIIWPVYGLIDDIIVKKNEKKVKI